MQVSYSRVSLFQQCPFKYKLRYIDGYTTRFDCDPANALILGTALHTGVEKGLETAIKEYYAAYPIIDDLHINEVMKFERVIPMLQEFLEVHEIEGKHEVRISTKDFIGFVDLITKKGDAYDFKYSNNIDRYMESSQLHLYKYHRKYIRDLYYIFVPKIAIRQKKTEDLYQFRQRLQEELSKAEIQKVQVPYDESKVTAFFNSVEEIKNCKTFEKKPGKLCYWCEFKSYCEDGDDFILERR